MFLNRCALDDFTQLEVTVEISDTLNCLSIDPQHNDWPFDSTEYIFLEQVQKVTSYVINGPNYDGTPYGKPLYRFDYETDTLYYSYNIEEFYPDLFDSVKVVFGFGSNSRGPVATGASNDLLIAKSIPYSYYWIKVNNVFEDGSADISYDDYCFTLTVNEEWMRSSIDYDTAQGGAILKIHRENKIFNYGPKPVSKIKKY